MPTPTETRGTDRIGRVPMLVLALVVPLVALATVVVTLDVTDDPSGSAATRGTGRAGTAIAIQNFQFSPNPIRVRAGTEVTVTNDDGTVHTLTAADHRFDTGDLAGGASTTVTITQPGTYRYFCDIHNYMTGTIEVR